MNYWTCVILICLFTSVMSDCIDESGKDRCFHPFDNNNTKVFYKFGLTNVLYKTNYTIINLEIPLDGFTPNYTDENWLNHPPIFFNMVDYNDSEDPHKGQYVLIDRVAHKIFDGRDATSDRSVQNSPVYFAGKDGIYVYDKETKSASKFGTIDDDIFEIEKVVGIDKFYILTSEYKLYAVTENGTVKNEVEGIKYAKDFILDLLGAIYFYGDDKKPQVLKQGETVSYKFDEYFDFEITAPVFARPSLNYDFNGMAFIANGIQYFLMNCSTVEMVPNTGKIDEITGYNADGFVYQFIATGGDLYEHYLLGHKSGTIVKPEEIFPPNFRKYDAKKKNKLSKFRI